MSPVLADCVEEVREVAVPDGTRRWAAWARVRLGGLQRRYRDQLCELTEVLGSGSEKELVSGT
jgi:hypothetical protein